MFYCHVKHWRGDKERRMGKKGYSRPVVCFKFLYRLLQ